MAEKTAPKCGSKRSKFSRNRRFHADDPTGFSVWNVKSIRAIWKAKIEYRRKLAEAGDKPIEDWECWREIEALEEYVSHYRAFVAAIPEQPFSEWSGPEEKAAWMSPS